MLNNRYIRIYYYVAFYINWFDNITYTYSIIGICISVYMCKYRYCVQKIQWNSDWINSAANHCILFISMYNS